MIHFISRFCWLSLGCLACQSTLSQSTSQHIKSDKLAEAVAQPVLLAMVKVEPLGSSDVHGVLRFEQQAGGVRITGNLEGLQPGKAQGMHIHEIGNCQAFDGSSAGGHFNPEQLQHGGLTAAVSHLGDLGNVQADGDGSVEIDIVKQRLQVAEGVFSVVGRSVIVHAEADDLRTDPSGNSGARVACGVIMAMGTDDPHGQKAAAQPVTQSKE